MHSLSKYLGLFIAKAFAGCSGFSRPILIKGRLWCIPIKQFKWRHPYTIIGECKLRVVYYKQYFQPVILIVVYKGTYLLVKVLIYNLSLAVSLGVKYSKELNFNPKDTAEFILKI
jgi:hypothetical protein